MKRPASACGYSLTEVMIVVAIVGVISSIGAVLFTQLQNFFVTATARNEIERDARASLDMINRNLRQAVSTSITIDTPSGQPYYSRISFNTIDGRSMKFYENGSQLIQVVTQTRSVTSILSRNLAYLGFCFPDTNNPTLINVSLTMSKSVQQGRRQVLQMSIQKVRIMN